MVTKNHQKMSKVSNYRPLRIGVMGDEECGKHALINIMLGEDIANKEELEEEEEVRSVEYMHPNNNKVFLLDIPHFVVNRHPGVDDYVEGMKSLIVRCDVVLCVYQGTFKQTDLQLHNNIVKLKKKENVFIVRMNLDSAFPDGDVKQHSHPDSYLVSNYQGTGDEVGCNDYNRLLSDITKTIGENKRGMLKNSYQSPMKAKYTVQREHLLAEWRVGVVALLPTLAGGMGALPIPVVPLIINLYLLLEATLHMGRPLGVFAEDSMLWSRMKCIRYLKRSGGLKFSASCMVFGEICRWLVVPLGAACSGLLYSFTTWGLLTRLQDQFLECARAKMEAEDEYRLF